MICGWSVSCIVWKGSHAAFAARPSQLGRRSRRSRSGGETATDDRGDEASDILRGSPIVAVVCSTKFSDPLLPFEIPLPSDPDGRCGTGLRDETVAVCNWIIELNQGSTRETGGIVGLELFDLTCRTAGLAVPPRER